MTIDAAQAALADRKARLILDGAVYRVGIVHAQATVTHGLRAESLIRGAVEHAVGAAGARLEAVLMPAGGRLQGLMPLAVAAFAYLSRKKLVKHAIVAGLVAVTVAALVTRRKPR